MQKELPLNIMNIQIPQQAAQSQHQPKLVGTGNL